MNTSKSSVWTPIPYFLAFVAALTGGTWLVSLAIDTSDARKEESTRVQADAAVQSRLRFIEWKNTHAPGSTYTCFDRWLGMSCTLSGGLLSTPIQVMCGRDGCWLNTPG